MPKHKHEVTNISEIVNEWKPFDERYETNPQGFVRMVGATQTVGRILVPQWAYGAVGYYVGAGLQRDYISVEDVRAEWGWRSEQPPTKADMMVMRALVSAENARLFPKLAARDEKARKTKNDKKFVPDKSFMHPISTPFYEMETGCKEFRSYDCPEMDPLTTRHAATVEDVWSYWKPKQRRRKAA